MEIATPFATLLALIKSLFPKRKKGKDNNEEDNKEYIHYDSRKSINHQEFMLKLDKRLPRKMTRCPIELKVYKPDMNPLDIDIEWKPINMEHGNTGRDLVAAVKRQIDASSVIKNLFVCLYLSKDKPVMCYPIDANNGATIGFWNPTIYSKEIMDRRNQGR